MGFDRRVVVALSVIALVLAPAAALRALCAGHSCDEQDEGAANVPFCSLPDAQRAGIVAGFREGRSPDVLVAPDETPDARVPLLFAGAGIDTSTSIPRGTTLDAVAPTIADIVGLDRPHPEVRSGTAIEGLTSGDDTRLVVMIVVEGLGSSDVDDRWDALLGMEMAGVSTDEAIVGSLPFDPAAVNTTIGTGGLPFQHGITGRLVRNDQGRMVAAWGPGAPVSVIAALGDDMDEYQGQDPMIGLIANSPDDRGLIGGGNWYVDNDRDVVRTERSPRAATTAFDDLIDARFGRDAVPDLIGVTLAGPPASVDDAIGDIESAARQATGDGATIVVTGTGSNPGDPEKEAVADIERNIEGSTKLIEGAVPAGFFVDQDALTETGKTEDEVIEAVKETGSFSDAFAAITVTFARYC